MVNANTGVDAGLAKINATLAANAVLLTHTDGESMDARLAQVDLSKNTDKYYVLQAVTDHTNHYVYSHWGRTGLCT
jgi:hypothetical protein